MSADECKRKQKPRVTGELSSEINERNLNERENRVFVCPICSHCSADISEMEEHGNKQHLDLTNSCEEQKATDLNFDCPICSNDFSNANDLEIHVNSVHEDILTPMKKPKYAENDSRLSEHTCPVCNSFSSASAEELTSHVNLHFLNDGQSLEDSTAWLPNCLDTSRDYLIAQELTRDFEREQELFELLKIEYGMNDNGNFREQSTKNMQRAVCSGKLTIPDYFDKEIELKIAGKYGIDDGNSCLKDVTPHIKERSGSGSNIAHVFLCSAVDFYASSYGDTGWGCGYRNLQMLLSSLFRNKTYNSFLYKEFTSKFEIQKLPSGNFMPCISKLQQMIEWAWSIGFDRPGCEQLGGKLYNTRKWIGSTEIVTLLSSLRFRCTLMDVHYPSSDGFHHKMFDWIRNYYENNNNFKPPLYLQHEGHSRTVIGIEILKTGEVFLLILDPGINKHTMAKVLFSKETTSGLGFMRQSLHNMKKQQYQIVTVVGVINSEQEYQDSKVIRSQKIF